MLHKYSYNRDVGLLRYSRRPKAPRAAILYYGLFISTSSNRKMSKLDYKTLEQGQNN